MGALPLAKDWASVGERKLLGLALADCARNCDHCLQNVGVSQLGLDCFHLRYTGGNFAHVVDVGYAYFSLVNSRKLRLEESLLKGFGHA